MAGAPDDDRESVDRAFAELVAGYHLTADRPDPVFPRDPVAPVDPLLPTDAIRPDAVVRPDPTRPTPARPDAARPEHLRPDPLIPDPLRPDHARPAPERRDDDVSDRADADGAENPRQHDPGKPAAGHERRWAEDHPLFRFDEPAEEPAEPAEERYVPPPAPPVQRPSISALVALFGFAFAVMVVFAASFGVPVPAWAGWGAVAGFVGAFALLITRLPRNRPPGDGAVL